MFSDDPPYIRKRGHGFNGHLTEGTAKVAEPRMKLGSSAQDEIRKQCTPYVHTYKKMLSTQCINSPITTSTMQADRSLYKPGKFISQEAKWIYVVSIETCQPKLKHGFTPNSKCSRVCGSQLVALHQVSLPLQQK